MEVRKATADDIPTIAAGCLQLYQSSPWRIDGVEDTIINQASAVAAKLGDQHVVFIAEDDGVVAGFVGAMLTTHPLHPSFPVASEWAMWVHPYYRGSRVLHGLLVCLKLWAKDHGAKGIMYAKPLCSVRPKHGAVEQLMWIEL